jgi:hypothetical protein
MPFSASLRLGVEKSLPCLDELSKRPMNSSSEQTGKGCIVVA